MFKELALMGAALGMGFDVTPKKANPTQPVSWSNYSTGNVVTFPALSNVTHGNYVTAGFVDVSCPDPSQSGQVVNSQTIVSHIEQEGRFGSWPYWGRAWNYLCDTGGYIKNGCAWGWQNGYNTTEDYNVFGGVRFLYSAFDFNNHFYFQIKPVLSGEIAVKNDFRAFRLLITDCSFPFTEDLGTFSVGSYGVWFNESEDVFYTPLVSFMNETSRGAYFYLPSQPNGGLYFGNYSNNDIAISQSMCVPSSGAGWDTFDLGVSSYGGFSVTFTLQVANVTSVDYDLNNSYQNGYDVGYNDGLNANTATDSLSWVGAAFDAIGRISSIKIAPGITLGTLVAIPVAGAVLVWLLKLLRG